MKCSSHPTVNAIGECVKCHLPVCTKCQVVWEETTYCARCIDEILGSEARIRLQQKAIPRQKEKAAEPKDTTQDEGTGVGRKTSKRAAVPSIKARTPAKRGWLLGTTITLFVIGSLAFVFVILLAAFYQDPASNIPAIITATILLILPFLIPGVICLRKVLAQDSQVMTEKGSIPNWWWLLPAVLGFVGGIISWVRQKKVNYRKAMNMLTLGIAVTIIWPSLIGVISLPAIPTTTGVTQKPTPLESYSWDGVIKIGVIGPMQFLQGQQQWLGATMAAEEINKAGGVKVGNKTYRIELIRKESNEISSIIDAATAMEELITVDKADFIIGGFRTEAVFPMQEIAMDYKKIFLGCGAATMQLNTPAYDDYDRYKYWFRVTPFPSNYLVDNTVMEIAMAGAILKEQTGIQRKLRVAICAEGAQWADGMTSIMQNWVPKKLGMEVSGTWRPSPNATELAAEMTAIQSAETDIICPIFSGPVGIPYARSWGELQVPAASVGINVESWSQGFLNATLGYGAYETSLNTYAQGLQISPLTVPFVDTFVAKSGGQLPTYSAGTYDAEYILAHAITRAGTLNSDAVVVELEKTKEPSTLTPAFTFTGMDAPLKNQHDVTYGPGAYTGIATQWQGRKMVAVWPNPVYANAYIAAGYSDSWKAVNYPGIARWQAPPLLIDRLKIEVAKQPPPLPPSAPSSTPKRANQLSFAAKTYADNKYGFSFQYPKDWVARPELMTKPDIHLAAFGVEAFIPNVVCYAFDADAPVSKDWIVNSFTSTGNTMPKVISDIKEETLADGTKAYSYKAGYVSATGYDVVCYCIDADKGDKWIRVSILTIDVFEPYNEALFSEIAHTLRFTQSPSYPSTTTEATINDDFSNSGNGWCTDSDARGEFAYEHGEYRALMKQSGSYRYCGNRVIGMRKDFTVEVDVRKLSGSDDAAGIAFRAQGKQYNDSSYAFWVNSSSGAYCIQKCTNGVWAPNLKDFTPSNYIHRGADTNRLKVVCKGSQIEVYANDYKLAAVSDTSLTSGYVGPAVGTWSSSSAHYRFDNFKLYSNY